MTSPFGDTAYGRTRKVTVPVAGMLVTVVAARYATPRSAAVYLASLPMSVFVSDYDHNAPNPAHLQETHCKLYRAIRAAHPEIPYIMVSRFDFDSAYEESIARRDVIFDTYRYARETGDRNVYYIDGASVFRGPDEDGCTVDGTHPNDHGFALFASALGAELKRAFTQGAF